MVAESAGNLETRNGLALPVAWLLLKYPQVSIL